MVQKSEDKSQIFADIISRRSLPELHKFLSGSTDAERFQFANKAIANYKAACKPSDETTDVGGFVFHTGRAYVDSFDAIAVLATANEEQLKKLTWGILLSKPCDFSILKELKPIALRTFGEVLIEQSENYFNLVLQLCKIEVCNPPTSDAAVFAWQSFGSELFRHRTSAEEKDSLLRDQNFLNDIIWRFFELNNSQGGNLASLDRRRADGGWAQIIKTLSEQGHISRDRLLRESLRALSRDFPQKSSAWFADFHEFMMPSVEERLALTEQYAILLGSTIPPTVSFAIKCLTIIDKSEPLSKAIITKYLPLTFTLKPKGPIIAALCLLEHGASLSPAYAQEYTAMAIEALQHEALDVQLKVCKLLEKFAVNGDKNSVEKIKVYAETVSPSAKKRLAPFLAQGTTPAIRPSSLAKSTYTMENIQLQGWPLNCCTKIAPIRSVVELLTVAASCLEHPHLVDDLERVTDAFSQLKVESTEHNNLIAPLRTRALKILSSKSSNNPQVQIAYADFLQCALEPTASPQLGETDKLNPLIDFKQMQFKAILKRIREGIFLPLLSAPTHIGGWVEPKQLIERQKKWNAAGLAPDDLDLTLTLLRIPEEERAMLANQKDICLDLKKAIETVESKVATEPLRSDLQTTADDSALSRAAIYMRGPIDTAYLPNFGNGRLLGYAQEISTINLRAICFPALRECVLAAGVNHAAVTIDGLSSFEHGVAGYFSMLGQSGAPLEKKAYELLAIGLIHSDIECLIFTRDACIAAIDERRLDVAKLGKRLSAYIHSGKNRPKRLVPSLTEIARLSEIHANAVIQILENTLQGEMRMVPVGLATILEFYQELLVEHNCKITNSATREYLEALPTGGKTAKLAKALLAKQ